MNTGRKNSKKYFRKLQEIFHGQKATRTQRDKEQIMHKTVLCTNQFDAATQKQLHEIGMDDGYTKVNRDSYKHTTGKQCTG